MTKVYATEVASFRDGEFRLCRLTPPKHHDGAGREGSNYTACGVPYAVGDLILCGADGFVICGPVNHDRAVDLARRVLEGEQRAVLDSRTAYVLSIGLLSAISPGAQPDNGG